MGVLPQSSGIKASKGRLSLESLNALFLPPKRGVVYLFVSTLNGFQLRHNFEIGSELKIDWSNNQGKESQNAKLGVPTTLPSQKDFRYFFFRWNKDVVFPTTIWLFCINFDHVPEKFNLHFASLVTKIGADWHGINNSLSKTTEDGDSRQNSQPTIQAVQQTWNKADFLRNCKMKTKILQI